MKAKLLGLALVALILAFAPVSRAGWTPLDDPAEGSTPWLLPSAARAATTTTSGVVNAPADALIACEVVTLTVVLSSIGMIVIAPWSGIEGPAPGRPAIEHGFAVSKPTTM